MWCWKQHSLLHKFITIPFGENVKMRCIRLTQTPRAFSTPSTALEVPDSTWLVYNQPHLITAYAPWEAHLSCPGPQSLRHRRYGWPLARAKNLASVVCLNFHLLFLQTSNGPFPGNLVSHILWATYQFRCPTHTKAASGSAAVFKPCIDVHIGRGLRTMVHR